jgi:hypothetical protein
MSAPAEGFFPPHPGPTCLSVAMPGSNADDIIGDYFEAEDWATLDETEPDPDLETPPPAPPSQ